MRILPNLRFSVLRTELRAAWAAGDVAQGLLTLLTRSSWAPSALAHS